MAKTIDGQIVSTALVGEIDNEPEEIDELDDLDEPAPVYRVKVNLDNMTWGDQMAHARFQLLIESLEDMPEVGENATVKEKDAAKAQRVASLTELTGKFEELTGYLARVAKVTRDGKRITFRDVPMPFVRDVMEAINAAQGKKKNPNA